MSRISTITLAALVALIAFYLVARHRYAGRAPVKLQAENCDRGLWKHIGEKEKLHIVEECTAVDGRAHPCLADYWWFFKMLSGFNTSVEDACLYLVLPFDLHE